MDLATEALGNLLPKLVQLLQDEYNLQTGAKKDIQFLSSELETIRIALREVGEVPREQLGDLQRVWTRDVREMSYDMEDIVDAFMVRVQGPDPHSKSSAGQIFNLKYMIQKFTKFMARREVAQKIRDIKERAREITERRDRYKVDIIAPSKKTLVDPRLKALYTEATEIVGIEEAKKEVIAGLTEGDGGQQKKIVSIAGFGGLGKTTLAKAVYDEIKGQFDCTAFVSVSRNPDAKKLLKDIMYELHKGGQPGAIFDEIKHLIDLVRDFLHNRRSKGMTFKSWAPCRVFVISYSM
ncbi:disease resistance protein PIK6-NP-like isoform X2 [Panicum virgatum]|uniref:disease resistance protein PIK6-NP-like isoform X2 n=1 Tax=Panicum virgatum TaxID=38727 RepID=UPI0019D68B96|nr:disease resistance protein PIK6-NP-like isoform X2 [Panicum virgatum]XP_039839318.1 disease resistance protein PIK6-NP-like isoform X2 [Panicum virgatum]